MADGTASILSALSNLQGDSSSQQELFGKLVTQQAGKMPGGTLFTEALKGVASGLGAAQQLEGAKGRTDKQKKLQEILEVELERAQSLSQLKEEEKRLKLLKDQKVNEQELINEGAQKLLSTQDPRAKGIIMKDLIKTSNFAQNALSQFGVDINNPNISYDPQAGVFNFTGVTGDPVAIDEKTVVSFADPTARQAVFTAAQAEAEAGTAGKDTFLVRRPDGTTTTVFGGLDEAQQQGQVIGTTDFQAQPTGEEVGLADVSTPFIREQVESVQSIDNLTDSINQAIDIIGESPEAVGLAGSLRRNLRALGATAESLIEAGRENPQLSGITSVLESASDEERQAFNQVVSEKTKGRQSAENVLPALETAIGFALAKSRDPGGRLSDQDIKRNSIDLTGITSPDQARDQLGFTLEELGRRRNRAIQTIQSVQPGASLPGGSTSQSALESAIQEEIRRRNLR